jgi:hypothetical protein
MKVGANNTDKVESRGVAHISSVISKRPAAVASRSSVEMYPHSSQPVIQGNFLPIDGTVKADRDAIRDFMAALAGNDPRIEAMKNDQTLLLYICINRSEDGGDGETRALWIPDQRKSQISVTIEATAEESIEKIKADLLHEIYLHVMPANDNHIGSGGDDPQYTDPDVDEDKFDQEEAAEHADEARWKDTVTSALAFGEAVWIETCKDAVRHLGANGGYGLQICLLLQAYDPDFAEVYLEE